MRPALHLALMLVLPCTAGEAEGLRFAAYGDSCGNPEVHARLARAIATHKPAFVVHTGDFVPQGDKGARWREDFLDPARELLALCPYFAVDGDDDRAALTAYGEQFRLPPDRPWHAQRFGDVELFGLSASSPFDADSVQARWLGQALEASRARWKIVVTHFPLYSAGRHGGHDGLRRAIIALLFRHGVDLVLSGHDHGYERTHAIGPEPGRALAQIVSGGGGQPLGAATPQAWTARAASRHHFCLFEATPGQLRLTAIADNADVLDRAIFAKRDGGRDFGQFLPAADVELLGYIRRFEKLRFTFLPGREQRQRLAFALKNPHERELRGELAWEIANPCWKIEPMRQAILVPPGGEAAVSFEAAFTPGAASAPEPLPQALLTSGALRATAPGFYLHEDAPKKTR
ncbi:MAG TPA: metallophosphoesterase [Planctomycetota bacterium]|nr:metallophosphoesterase [Planctomycetota bacterium]HRR81305.1 metallophosphoesterase [Planctomycetota bacterium]HRT95806.1 metallophosphoesterase [Planctomycetota bacterium]